jgi:hypothetical protein
MKFIELRHATIQSMAWGCVTTFNDGAFANSVPHDSHHYHVIAHRCGYGDDISAYCFEHDFVHSLLCERIFSAPSPILWGVAHKQPLSAEASMFEEIAVQATQRWLRSNERPIIAGIEWDDLKQDAMRLLE